MSAPALHFPPYPIRGVRVRHVRQNCAPHFAEVVVDFEPSAGGFAFEVAEGLCPGHEPAEALPRFFAAVAAGMEEGWAEPGRRIVPAVTAVLRDARAEAAGSHELAFRIAGYLAARQAVERMAAGPGAGA